MTHDTRSAGTRYTSTARQRAVKLYREGKTLAAIARLKKMPNNVKVIRNWLELEGVVIRPKPPLYPREEILAKLANGHTRNDIAEEYGCSLKFLSNLATGKIHSSNKKKAKKAAKKKTTKKITKKMAKTTKKKLAKRKTAKKKTAKRKKR